ncbi:transmembrane prolyl 4-hydroxylase isoform X2 [Paramisgurnus dabryanus]|uniref:transmembrane prolyl 4-hydroxylase isoform X2 n=1 Tax=Paramisgurnus dabryanus TaxID=90735 RepID=UPI0031F47029
MIATQENTEQDDAASSSSSPPPAAHSLPRQRVSLKKSSVCSRSYFMVVMVFFHVYIINVIALLLYVHYNNGSTTSVPNQDYSSTGSSPKVSAASDAQTPADSGFPRLSIPRIEGIRVGHVQKVSLVPGKVHEMKTLSLKPLLFEIPNFLSAEECGVIVRLAQLKGLMESQVMVPEGQEELNQQLNLSPEEIFNFLDLNQDGQLQPHEILTHSRVRDGIWLTSENLKEIYDGLKVDLDGNGLLSLEEFGRLRSDAFQRFLLQRGVERSQLVRNSRHTWLYQGQGAHQVLQDLRKRYITVLFYLNNVEEGGETTFPVADNRTYEEASLIQNDVDLLDTRKHCDKGNLRVKPTKGTAVFWYNYLSDGRGWVGEQDEYSLHGGCVVTRGTKWVANNWINVDPVYQRQALYQQFVSQQQEMQEQEEIISDQHTETHQDL